MMKESFDKEIDSLLRRRLGAEAGARALGDGDATRAGAHLDADELSAFAEGALPVAARAAAASHMVDCDECRGLAVNLARASGAEAELERRAVAVSVPASESVSARGRGWLASFFAPRSLRFVAPVLALCLVAVISFVALRARRGEANLAQQTLESDKAQNEVAKNVPAGSTLDATATTNANSKSGAGVAAPGGTAGESRNAGAPAPVAVAKDEVATGGAGSSAVMEDRKADEPAPPPAKAEAPAAYAPPVMSKMGPPPEAGDAAKSEDKEKSAKQSQPEEETATNDLSALQQRRSNNQARGIDVQMPDGARNQKRGATENSTAGSSEGSLASSAPKPDRDRSAAAQNATATRRGRSSEAKRERSEDDEAARADGERNIAGHRFRRDGGAWVDLNYKTSMSSTGVRRGRDAYRALVADIPEIGRIAEQLSGEVIVVVKGRAYRIR